MELQFLENDYQCPDSDEDIRDAKRRLRYANIDLEHIENMQIHYQFRLMDKEDVYKIIFNKENVLVTYSMYVSGSDSDFLYLIGRAGSNDIKGITYIDTSGQLPEFLNRKLRDVKELAPIVCGINSNNILTYDYEDNSLKRIKIQFTGMYDDCVVYEPGKIEGLYGEQETK